VTKLTEETMTTETSNQEEAKKIWAQLEAEENGTAEPQAPEVDEAPELDTAQAVSESQEQTQTEEDDDPKALRQKLAGMEAIITQLSGRLRNAEGHIGGLNSQVKQQLEAAKQVKAAGADAPSTGEIRAAQDNPAAMAELERDYPEFAKALKPAIEATLASRMAAYEQRMQPAQPTGEFASKQEIESFKAELRVESRHPGWQETVAKPEFIGWLQSGPREYQMLAGSNEPSDAIRLLDIYNESKKTSGRSTTRLTSAAAMPTGQRSAVRTKNVDDMTSQEYWRYLDQLDK
jgi:hypothetical protein